MTGVQTCALPIYDLWFEFLTDEGLVDRAVEGARKAEVMRLHLPVPPQPA